MSGSAYYDDCPAGCDRFHESDLAAHWPHALAEIERLKEGLREMAALQPMFYTEHDDVTAPHLPDALRPFAGPLSMLFGSVLYLLESTNGG